MAIENYLGVFEIWEVLMKIRSDEEKKKNPPIISTAFITLSCMYSGLAPDQQYRLFNAMINLIGEENPRKLDDNEIDNLAGILLLAAEVRRNLTKAN